jgi:hypothetical protein
MVNIQSSPLITVKEILRAIFPLSKKLTKFEVTPPGHNEMIIKPTLVSGVKSEKLIIKKAIKGRNSI